MSDTPQTQPSGWYYAHGDPAGTQRFWDGSSWQGGPQPVPGANLVGHHDQLGGPIADPVTRVGARVIDGGLWFVIGYVVPLAVRRWLFGSESISWFDFSPLTILAFGVMVVAYESLMIGSRGCTVGKLLMSMSVVNDNGTFPDRFGAFRRMTLLFAFVLLSMLGLLGILALSLIHI